MNMTGKYIIPLTLGSELQTVSFKLVQQDLTYRLASPRYQQFYESYIRPRVAMYRGWIEGYHNLEYGVIPSLFLQKIGNGIISTLFGKPLVLNTSDAKTSEIIVNEYKKSNFNYTVKEAYNFALDGGTCLIKWNKDGNQQLKAEAIPMDKFFVSVDAYGNIERVKSYLTSYHDTVNSTFEYYLCEERFFRYARDLNQKFPMVHYLIYRSSSNITHESKPNPVENLDWSEIPFEIKRLLKADYGDLVIDGTEGYSDMKNCDKCKLLPFNDDLGCRLIKFTRNIPAFPKMPFGQPLADLLMNENYAYDQLKYFERLEVYIARGRILINKMYMNENDKEPAKGILDPMVFTYYETLMGEVDDKKPQGLQLDLRAENINRQKQNILNDTAFSLNMSSTTIASWLSDGQTQKTATEIEYERTKTTAFINDKIELIRDPLQEMIDIFFHYYGVTSPELNIMPENQTVRTEAIRLFSELYDKKQITAEMLAKEILGTNSIKEVNELSSYMNEQRMMAEKQQMEQNMGGLKNE